MNRPGQGPKAQPGEPATPSKAIQAPSLIGGRGLRSIFRYSSVLSLLSWLFLTVFLATERLREPYRL